MHSLAPAVPAQADNTIYQVRLNVWALVLIFQCLVMALPALKLLHVSPVSNWPWLWVTLPIWSPSALLAMVLGGEQLAGLGKAKALGQEHGILVGTSVVN